MEKLRKVRIKTWEEMEKEFDINTWGHIKCKCHFLPDMEDIIPEDRVIEIDEKSNWVGQEVNWSISEDMISEYIEETPPQISKDYYYSNLGKFELCTRKTHQTHYIKWKLTDNLSIRYFYSFQDNPDFIGKFVLKNHSKKESVIISKDTAKELLEFVKEDFEEIIGYLEKDEYRKLVLVGGDIKNISVLINDKVTL